MARDVTIGLRYTHCCLGRGERGVVVRLRHLVGDIVGINDPVCSINDERPLAAAIAIPSPAPRRPGRSLRLCPREQPMTNALGAAPAGLGEGEVHADGVKHHLVGEVRVTHPNGGSRCGRPEYRRS